MYKLQSLIIKNIISFVNQEYHFQNGKAMLVVGRNLTDSSQRSNGAGKSALLESISLCISGSSVRDVKNRELINRNADNAEVELTLFNTRSNTYFKIWRKIYANSKSAEYKAWINDKEQSDRYADFNMFNSFVWETIGISKEDFFSFYFLTGDYVPFLNTSDSAKN
jgi:exonuclease SbcC